LWLPGKIHSRGCIQGKRPQSAAQKKPAIARLELACSIARLCGDMLIRNRWRTGAMGGVLNGHRANVTLGIHVKNGVFSEVSSQ
jgi:hypothetical protein